MNWFGDGLSYPDFRVKFPEIRVGSYVTHSLRCLTEPTTWHFLFKVCIMCFGFLKRNRVCCISLGRAISLCCHWTRGKWFTNPDWSMDISPGFSLDKINNYSYLIVLPLDNKLIFSLCTQLSIVPGTQWSKNNRFIGKRILLILF